MDRKTAEHYNRLRAAAQPATFVPADGAGPPMIDHPVASVRATLIQRAHAIATGCVDACVAAEIRDAATHGREIRTLYWPPNDWPGWGACPFAVRVIGAAAPEIQAMLDRDNAERAARFESFRLACAAGTASAPDGTAP